MPPGRVWYTRNSAEASSGRQRIRGGDQLLTIEFETVGTKLLMARFAAAMLKKEE